jgi:hypothetical protein
MCHDTLPLRLRLCRARHDLTRLRTVSPKRAPRGTRARSVLASDDPKSRLDVPEGILERRKNPAVVARHVGQYPGNEKLGMGLQDDVLGVLLVGIRKGEVVEGHDSAPGCLR